MKYFLFFLLIFSSFSPVSYSLLALLCFQALIFVLSLMLVCYTPRDGVEVILAKNGLQVSQTITSSMQRDGQYRTLTTNTRSERFYFALLKSLLF